MCSLHPAGAPARLPAPRRRRLAHSTRLPWPCSLLMPIKRRAMAGTGVDRRRDALLGAQHGSEAAAPPPAPSRACAGDHVQHAIPAAGRRGDAAVLAAHGAAPVGAACEVTRFLATVAASLRPPHVAGMVSNSCSFTSTCTSVRVLTLAPTLCSSPAPSWHDSGFCVRLTTSNFIRTGQVLHPIRAFVQYCCQAFVSQVHCARCRSPRRRRNLMSVSAPQPPISQPQVVLPISSQSAMNLTGEQQVILLASLCAALPCSPPLRLLSIAPPSKPGCRNSRACWTI